jgi:1,4-alpha-glucan branching enzyme
LEIITSAATHALLPFLSQHLPSLRAQVLTGCDHYRNCFGCEPRGIWLPECAYAPELDKILQEAGLRWFIVEAHGILLARPQPRLATFAPILTKSRMAVFGRDRDSAQQVWSRQQGYPGDGRYRDFYRDIGFDLEFSYLAPFISAPGQREFTGFKYYRSSNGSAQKEVYDRRSGLEAVAEHADHFIEARRKQIMNLADIFQRPPILVCPFDAELFGHWWYEGPEFVDSVVRRACADNCFAMITPEDYLGLHPTLQLAEPAASSWGEGGYWGVWLNEENKWIYPQLSRAQERMMALANRFERPDPLQRRVLKQAARELMLAQASDWPFIIRAGTSPDFAEKRLREHLNRFSRLYQEISNDNICEQWLSEIETQNNIFPEINYRYWAE